MGGQFAKKELSKRNHGGRTIYPFGRISTILPVTGEVHHERHFCLFQNPFTQSKDSSAAPAGYTKGGRIFPIKFHE